MMAARLVALYRTPPDPSAFLDHYRTVHTPLARALPGLTDMTVSRVTGRVAGEEGWFLLAVMGFPNRQTLDQALSSPAGRAAYRDLRQFADGLVTLLVTEDDA
jgi:uncharacterized protein (TIGR02118 family)